MAAIADDIAYDNHDIDDGLRSGILLIDELVEDPLVKRHWRSIERRYPGIEPDKMQRALVRNLIGSMVGDVIAETARRVKEAGVQTIDDVRGAGRQLAGFSSAMGEEEEGLKRLLYARLYGAEELDAVRHEAQRVVANLAAAYRSDPALLPEDGMAARTKPRASHDRGLIAGRTDRFALRRHEAERVRQPPADGGRRQTFRLEDEKPMEQACAAPDHPKCLSGTRWGSSARQGVGYIERGLFPPIRKAMLADSSDPVVGGISTLGSGSTCRGRGAETWIGHLEDARPSGRRNLYFAGTGSRLTLVEERPRDDYQWVGPKQPLNWTSPSGRRPPQKSSDRRQSRILRGIDIPHTGPGACDNDPRRKRRNGRATAWHDATMAWTERSRRRSASFARVGRSPAGSDRPPKVRRRPVASDSSRKCRVEIASHDRAS